MSILSTCALALGALSLIFVLKPQQREISVLIGIFVTTLLYFWGIERSSEVLEVIRTVAMEIAYKEEISTLLKALGVATIVQISSDICRDAGEASIGTQLERIGKVEILLLSLPLAADLLSLVERVL